MLKQKRSLWLQRLEASGIGSDDAEDLVQDALVYLYLEALLGLLPSDVG